ncbi:7641_t:CDS:2, partial [Scutellospora calospora]
QILNTTTAQATPQRTDSNISQDTDESLSAPPSKNLILTPEPSSPSSDGPVNLLTPEPERPSKKRKGKQIESQEKRRIVKDYSPKKPRSALNYFTREFNSSEDTAHILPKERYKLSRKKWKEMSTAEKDKYVDKSQTDKKKYDREVAGKEHQLRHDRPSEGERELLYVLVPTPSRQMLSAYQDYHNSETSSPTTNSNRLGQNGTTRSDSNVTNDTCETVDNIEGSTSSAVNHASNIIEADSFTDQLN